MPASHVSHVRVRYAETDTMQVLHHSVWPIYWEVARSDLLRARTLSYAELERRGILFPVLDYGVEMLAPAHYDDEIEIRSRVGRMGRVKLRFDYEGLRDGKLLARGFSLHGVIDKDWRAKRLPGEIAEALSRD